MPDFILSATYHSNHTDYDVFLCYGAAYGYAILPKLTAIAEITGTSGMRSGLKSLRVNIAPGFTYQFNNHLLFVWGLQYDIAGKNDLSGINYLTAFTMKF